MWFGNLESEMRIEKILSKCAHNINNNITINIETNINIDHNHATNINITEAPFMVKLDFYNNKLTQCQISGALKKLSSAPFML